MTDYSLVVPKLGLAEKQRLSQLLGAAQELWIPQEGPQTQALESMADVMFYGGSAGGGKTDLVLGAAVTRHQRSLIMRREGTQFRGIVQRMIEIVGNRDGYNGQLKQWRIGARLVEFGACPHLGDEADHQGIPHDLIAFDEITHFLEFQFRFLLTWLRSVDPNQRCRVIATGNPPTSSEGNWVRDYWGPWLDPQCPVKAEPGQLLWFITHPLTGEDTMVDGPEPLLIGDELVTPLSRTFIPSNVNDNAYLLRTNYKTQLQGLPEPLRSQMLHGDFSAGMDDDVWQVIPTAAVKAAQARWAPMDTYTKMTAVGVDVARGGRDKTVLARRHGDWWDDLILVPGSETPDGPSVVSLYALHQRNNAVACIDAIGVGTSVIDFMASNGHRHIAVDGAARSDEWDSTHTYQFANLRSQLYWKFREALTAPNCRLALPPSASLLTDLTSARFSVKPGKVGKIAVEAKEDIIRRIGRSPDEGDAVIYSTHPEAAQTMYMGGEWVDWDTPIRYNHRGVI